MDKYEDKKALYYSLCPAEASCFPALCTATGCVCARVCMHVSHTHKIKEINPENCSSSPDTSSHTHTHTHAQKDRGDAQIPPAERSLIDRLRNQAILLRVRAHAHIFALADTLRLKTLGWERGGGALRPQSIQQKASRQPSAMSSAKEINKQKFHFKPVASHPHWEPPPPPSRRSLPLHPSTYPRPPETQNSRTSPL